MSSTSPSLFNPIVHRYKLDRSIRASDGGHFIGEVRSCICVGEHVATVMIILGSSFPFYLPKTRHWLPVRLSHWLQSFGGISAGLLTCNP